MTNIYIYSNNIAPVKNGQENKFWGQFMFTLGEKHQQMDMHRSSKWNMYVTLGKMVPNNCNRAQLEMLQRETATDRPVQDGCG